MPPPSTLRRAAKPRPCALCRRDAHRLLMAAKAEAAEAWVRMMRREIAREVMQEFAERHLEENRK